VLGLYVGLGSLIPTLVTLETEKVCAELSSTYYQTNCGTLSGSLTEQDEFTKLEMLVLINQHGETGETLRYIR